MFLIFLHVSAIWRIFFILLKLKPDVTFIDLMASRFDMNKSDNITFYSHNGWIFKMIQAVIVVIWKESELIKSSVFRVIDYQVSYESMYATPSWEILPIQYHGWFTFYARLNKMKELGPHHKTECKKMCKGGSILEIPIQNKTNLCKQL